MRRSDFEEFRVTQARRDAGEKKGRVGPAWDFTSSASLRHAGLGTWWETALVVLGVVILAAILLDIVLPLP
jgi:hypothetical protein